MRITNATRAAGTVTIDYNAALFAINGRAYWCADENTDWGNINASDDFAEGPLLTSGHDCYINISSSFRDRWSNITRVYFLAWSFKHLFDNVLLRISIIPGRRHFLWVSR